MELNHRGYTHQIGGLLDGDLIVWKRAILPFSWHQKKAYLPEIIRYAVLLAMPRFIKLATVSVWLALGR